MEKEQAKLQSLEVAEFVSEFSTPKNQQLPRSYASAYDSSVQQLPPGKMTLGEFMRSRNKAPAPINNIPSISSVGHVVPQSDFNQQIPSFYQTPGNHQQMPPMSYSQVPAVQQPFVSQYPGSSILPNIPAVPPNSQPSSYIPLMNHSIMSTAQHNLPQTTSQNQIPHAQYQYAPVAQPFGVQQSSQPVQPPQQPFYSQPTSLAPSQQRPPQSYLVNQPINQSQVPSPAHNYYPTSQQPAAQNNYPTSQQSAAAQNNYPTPINQRSATQNSYSTPINQQPTNGFTHYPKTDSSQSAQGAIDDLFAGNQTLPKPPDSSQLPHQAPPRSSHNPETSKGSPSPWHTSTINPLLINRK